ncbi:MAG: DUF3108 domain-containing protein, partial [Chitinophagaceae bacterium]|nr:DUF3108 domain-containing protein [Rubrivivax sp.]
HVDRRRGRDLRATNFDRENGHIAYSASPRRHVLPPGVQDRLSWMLQLPAMLEADPALAAPGTELLLAVAGARGQMGVWTFDVVGAESLALPGGEVPAALHLQRAARRPYDTQVDVWLDPARAHLPVRLKVSAPPAPGVTEWRLQSLSTP